MSKNWIARGTIPPSKRYTSLVMIDAAPSFSNANEKEYTKTGLANMKIMIIIQA